MGESKVENKKYIAKVMKIEPGTKNIQWRQNKDKVIKIEPDTKKTDWSPNRKTARKNDKTSSTRNAPSVIK